MCRQADALRALAFASGELSAACTARLENGFGPPKRRNRRAFGGTVNDADATPPGEQDALPGRPG